MASSRFCEHGNNIFRFRKDPKKRTAPLVIICFLCVDMVPLHLLVLCGLHLFSLLMAFVWFVGWLVGLVWSGLVGRSVAILRKKQLFFASSVSPLHVLVLGLQKSVCATGCRGYSP